MRGPRGLDASDEFVEYMATLREEWPADPELAEKHGMAAGNGHSETEKMTQTDSTNDAQTTTDLSEPTTRRTFMKGAGVAAAGAITTGVAAATDGDTPSWASELVQSPRIETTATIATHGADMSDPLAYTNDNGDPVSLADEGAVVADRDDADTPHNPITLRADRLAAQEVRAFPRGITYDDDSDTSTDEVPVDAVDATHWTTDTSGTAGSLTFETVTGQNGEEALHIATSGQTSGDVATATFDLSSVGSDDATITEGVERKMIQAIATIASLDSGAVVEIRVKDSSSNTITSVIDSSADSGSINTIATATGSGVVYQEQVGEFSTTVGDIQTIELAVKEANADVTFTGLNVEKEAEWEFGVQEYTNSDDELDTQTITHPSGEFSVVSLYGSNGVPDTWTDAAIEDLKVDAEFRAAELDSDMREYRWADAGRYDYPARLETLVGLELPTAYDLSYSSTSLRDTVLFPSTRFLASEYTTSESALPTWSDIDDESVTFTDETATFENAGIDDEVTLTSSVSAGTLVVVHQDYLLNSDEKASATASGGGSGGGPVGSSGGGIFDGFMGLVMSGIVGVLGYLGVRGRF